MALDQLAELPLPVVSLAMVAVYPIPFCLSDCAVCCVGVAHIRGKGVILTTVQVPQAETCRDEQTTPYARARHCADPVSP